jgi:hypothetical protein
MDIGQHLSRKRLAKKYSKKTIFYLGKINIVEIIAGKIKIL